MYFFVQQISSIELSQVQNMKLYHPLYLILVLILLPFNWGMEFIKWRKILNSNRLKFNLLVLVRSLFSGVTTGVLTPNRIGNFIGRMLFFKGKVRGQLILGTLYSNFAQFLISILFGLIGFIILEGVIFKVFEAYITSVLITISIISFLFYFSVPFIHLPNLKFLNRRQNSLIEFQGQSRGLVFPIFILSAVRYLIFSFQYLLLLMTFGVKISIDIYTAIFLVYLLSTLTPSMIFGKLVVRESAGLLILGLFIDNDVIIIFSSLLLWFINLGIPSLLGLVFILRKKTLTDV